MPRSEAKRTPNRGLREFVVCCNPTARAERFWMPSGRPYLSPLAGRGSRKDPPTPLA